jgi:hypothetical protein
MWWWWTLGGLCVCAALLTLWHYVTELTLGENSSRFAGAVLAGGAYFYAARLVWAVSIWAQVLVLIALAALAVVAGRRAWASQEDEFWKAAESSGGLLAAAGFLVLASYLFSLT